MKRNMNVIRETLKKLLFFIILTLGTTSVWGQDYSGVYYIANKIWNGDHNGSNYWYDKLTPEQRWYLVPAKDPQQGHAVDAYYSSNYGTTDGDSEKPFLTTYQTNRDKNSVWIVKKTGSKYYLIHALTGKYVKYEPPVSNAKERMSVHLEAVDGDSPGNVFQYTITPYTENNISGYNIQPTQENGTAVGGYLNPAGENWEYYYGWKKHKSGYWCTGILGVYNNPGGGQLWPFEPATLDAPTINDDAYPTVTVTDSNELPSGYHFRYTFGDGTQSDPTAESAILEGGSFTVTSSGTLKVVIERYGIVLTEVASKELGPAKPTFNVNSDGSVSISATGSIYYTLDGNTPTTSSTPYSSSISASDIASAEGMAIKTIVVDNQGITSLIAELPLNSYTYKIVNKSKAIGIQKTVKQVVGKPLSNGNTDANSDGITDGYNDIPAEIQSPYISDETITFYAMEGEFDANNLDDEHKITETPAGSANIYITYTTTNLGSKFVKLSGSSPYNLTYSTNGYLYDTDSAIGFDGSPDEGTMVTNPYLWYFEGDDPYALQIRNAKASKFLTTSSSEPARSDAAVTFILTAQVDGADASHKTITLKNLANSETITLGVNTVVLPISYTLIDRKGAVIETNIAYDDTEGFELPDAWQSPVVDYHYWNANAFVGTDGTPTVPFVFKNDPAPSEITSPTQVTSNNVIYVTYTLKSDNTIDLDGRNSLNVTNKVNKTYRLRFLEGVSFNQEKSDAVMPDPKTKAIYPYSNGDATLYVYGQKQWDDQLASGASTRTRWLWIIEPANNPSSAADLDPYHIKISSYQTQTSYKIDDNNTRNFHSYLRTYKPDDYSAIVTGVTNDNPLAHGGAKADPAVTALPEGSEYMLLGTSLSSLKLVTVDKISDGSTTERRTINSFEQYWKNNPTVQGKLTTKVTAEGREITLLAAQKTEIAAIEGTESLKWHSYNTWANSQPWVNNGDAAPGKAATTSKKFLNEEHVFQTISMGSGAFTLEETEIKPMLILLDQHGWEIVRLPLPSGPDDPNRAARYADIHKYSSPMVARYHFWKTGSKVPGYHKYKVSDYATVSATDDTEYTEDELGRADLNNSTPNLPNYESQAFVNGKERDWYVTYDVKPEYASTYAGAATEEATSAAPFLVKQGGVYAKVGDNNTLTTDSEPASIEDVPTTMQWYLRPNFDIDKEMGYIYAGNPGAEEEAKSKEDTELDYFDHTREGAVSTWSNGFDPYNVQIQSVSNTARYFTANTEHSAVTSSWTGTSSSLSLQNLGTKQSNIEGLDNVKMNITNATFMVVDDGNGNMRLMPRFDNTKVMQSFTTLATQAAAAPANDNGAANQSLFLTLVPKVVTSSSQINAMGGYYMLASNFTASGSIGTKDAPFKGIIEGQIDHSFSVSAPFIAYAEDAIIRNVIIESSSVSSGNDDGHAGAIVATALGDTRIYNCGVNGGSVSGTNHVGGIAGHLDGNARVINCYSYATIAGGSDVGGIVGYNNVTTTAAMIDEGNGTMVMNCMFYGDITGGTTVSPVYGGNNINNLNSGGLNTFNYYAYDVLTKEITTGKYNCALGVEDVFLKRFETYRQLLNSNRRLAAYYATSSKETVHAEDMMKWVLETADRSIAEPKPYPVLKAQGKYPSIINYDTRDLANYSEENRNQGLKTGTLNITILTKSQKTDGGQSWPTAAASDVQTTSLTAVVRTDKDAERFNFNYDKIQLPYYNDIGTGNYTENRVVTGWKITSITASAGEGNATEGTFTKSDTWGGYNFADRRSYAKDLYTKSKRVFAQGAYFDVPYGVTAIEIEPYWGEAAYVADQYLDVVYNTNYGRQDVSQLPKPFGADGVEVSINGSQQTVWHTIGTAVSKLGTGGTVYDHAVVLVGNVHLEGALPSDGKPFNIMSADLDFDNEPDCSFIFGHNDRQAISPVRFDFINMPGIAMAQKPNGAGTFRNVSIFKPKGWFETTNTCITRFVQFEYDNGGKSAAPVIIQGGMVDQFVSTKTSEPKVTQYIHLGGNVWFRDFGNGTHSDGNKFTPHIPISVTGGDFDGFYLSGTYRPDAEVKADNAECYVSGGHFGEMAGAAQQQINGDVQWQIYNADIDNFYGGGINFDKPVTGHITTEIINSHVGTFCGGPKFGDMAATKNVTTTATGCTFDTYFGAGYGGISYNRIRTRDKSGTDVDFSSWKGDYTGKRGKYYTDNKGIATDFDYEFFVWSTGVVGARFYVKYSSLSMAKTNDVSSTLTNCIINKNFYGGGNLGKVDGKATSVLNSCTVEGNVFGGGYSASTPKVPIRTSDVFASTPGINADAGVFDMGEKSATEDYTLVQGTLTNNSLAINKDTKTITTNVDMTVLGQVTTTDLTISGNTIVKGQIFDEEGDVLETTGGVFGGGDMSAVNGNTDVKVQGTEATEGVLNVFGGGNKAKVAMVKGTTTVEIDGTSSIKHYVYGGGNEADVQKTTTVNMKAGTVKGSIYGGGNLGDVGRIDDKSNKRQYIWTGLDGNANSTEPYATNNSGVTHVNITGGTVGPAGDAVSTEENPGNVFGGGKGAATSFWCENGMVYSTNVSISDGTVKGSVYGGGELGRVETDTKVTIGPETGDHNTEIKGNVFGAGKGVQTHGYSALVRGNTEVIVQNGSKVNQNVYGGGEIASVGKYSVDSNGMPYSLANNGSGICHVTIPGATQITGDIFGGGKGFVPSDTFLDNETYTGDDLPKRMTIDGEGNSIWQNYNNRTDYLIYLQTLALATETEVIINPGTSATPIQSTKGNVYGGSENGIVQHSTSVTISGDCKIGDEGIATSGNIYGGGKGHEKMEGAGLVGENAVVTINSGNVLASVFGGGVLGATKGNVTVNINGGTVNHDVYGGGAYAHTNTSNWHLYSVVENPTNPQSEGLYERSFGGAYTLTTDTEPVTSPEVKTYYRKNESATWIDPTQKSALNTTRLNLRGGTIVGDAYGGALGDASHSPKVYGDILVDLNKETCTDSTNVTTKTASEKGCVVNQVFGCNNAYGSPQGNVTVHVYGTQNKDASKTNIAAKFAKDDIDVYDVQAVYGGGNKAAYEPAYPDEATTSKSQVIIEGCELTSINHVYGGGNAAPVPSTDVTIKGTYLINAVYGGGNGSGAGNPGADVGKKTNGSTYGTGIAKTKLLGGYINSVYGGSNTKGDVVGGTDVSTKKQGDVIDGNCCSELKVGTVYGAGSHADVSGNVNIILECMPEDFVDAVYGGAEMATVNGNVSLTVTSGKFGRVFGGNNAGGDIRGSITVNVYEDGCKPLIIGELYGGGNQAPYSIYGCTKSGEAWTANTDPEGTLYFNEATAGRAAIQVNAIAFTSIGKVFGGGNQAEVIGNTHVWINTMKGIVNGVKRDNIGKIGQVFGGGNAARVKGNTFLDIGTSLAQDGESNTIENGVRIISGDDYLSPTSDANTSITAGIYGGGYSADVEGDATLNIGTANLPLGVNITGNIFGGGFGETTHVTGDVKVNIGTNTGTEVSPVYVGYANITGDVYGGSAKGKVNSHLVSSVETATAGKTTQVNLFGGTISGNLYGGGLGEDNEGTENDHAADVYGPVTVNVDGGTVNNVFGCNNVLGMPKSTVDVEIGTKIGAEAPYTYIGTGTISGSVYGGGNMAACTGSPTVKLYKGTLNNNVYGGGLGSTAVSGGASVIMEGGTVGNDVFGGGSLADVTGNVSVSVSGGTITHDVYGGGALANTNTANWDPAANAGAGGWKVVDATSTVHYEEVKHLKAGDDVSSFYTSSTGAGAHASGTYDANTTYYKQLTHPADIYNIAKADGHTQYTTTVSLTGGVIGNAYGGGLGRLGTGVHYTVDECDTYNATLPGALSTTALTADQAAKYNATLTGAIAANTTLTGTLLTTVNGLTGVSKTYTDGQTISAADAALYNATLSGAKAEGAQLTSELANTYNAKLPGARTTTDWATYPGEGEGNIKAMVYGDVEVTVNGTAFTDDIENINSSENVAKHGRVFGCNNLNGTPKGKVTVTVNSTKRVDGSSSHVKGEYEIQAVYGGGNLANYVPETYDNPDNEHPGQTEFGQKTKVYIDGCQATSIRKVYGGGNAANVPISNVEIDGAFEIGYVFGGGNGGDQVNYGQGWQRNPGANVTHYANVMLKGGTIGQAFGGSDTRGSVGGTDIKQSTSADCPLRIVNLYGAGNGDEASSDGDINITVSACGEGSEIQNVFGGSYKANIKGSVTLNITSGIFTSVYGGNDRMGSIGGDIVVNIEETDDCSKPIIIQNLYGGCYQTAYPGEGAKNTFGGDFLSGKITVNVKSATRIDRIFGGSENGPVTGDTEVNINMTRGSMSGHSGVALPSYYGNTGAKIPSNITVTDSEGGYVEVHGLVTNANADASNPRSSVVGYFTKTDTYVAATGTAVEDVTYYSRMAVTNSNYYPVAPEEITVGSDDVQGYYTRTGEGTNENPYVFTEISSSTTAADGVTYYRLIYNYSAVPAGDITVGTTDVSSYYTKSEGSYLAASGLAIAGFTYYKNAVKGTIKNEIGTIGEVYGGGNKGIVTGNAVVNIGTATSVNMVSLENASRGVYGAHIDGDVFGGGRMADVQGNTEVNICTKDNGSGTYVAVAEGTDKVTIDGSVYGGGSSADVLSNTTVRMYGGYVFDGVYGGGLLGSVGTVATRASLPSGHPTHTGCVEGKPETFAANTGKCTVVVSGGQVGPVEVALEDGGMKNTRRYFKEAGDPNGPVDVGFVFGAGRGEVENPDTDPDADFRTYVKETDVTISGGIVMASVYGGGENGRVRGDTKVTISGGQIGCGEGKTQTVAGKTLPLPYTEDQWSTANPSVFTECASWDYGKVYDGDTKKKYLPYDPLANVPYRDGTTVTNGSTEGSDGHTYYGYVFGGGSGYFPYEIKDADGNVIAHDWLASAGVVEGNTKVEITGGHILTCVYGGNELTSVKGDCEVIMSGGTLGVPRSNEDILKKPVTCYLFGGGKGDQREHFKMYTNVKNTRVEVKGTARIFGSVFGGAEDGHVSGNAKVNILGTARIGMSGTSYVDGNIFGGGRGFSGTELTAGTVKGNTEINISGTPTLLGSVYGGGRLASVGVDFAGAQNATTGQFVEDGGGKTYGHVTINISGGTIGKEGVTGDGAKYSGNVFGGSMGRLTLLDGSPNSLWNRMAQVKTSSVNITGGTIKRNVYGGAEFGTTRDHVYVTVGGTRAANGDITPSGSPVINGSVFGGGKGSTEHRAAYNSYIEAGSGDNAVKYLFTPLQYAGCIGGDTYVNVVGSGHVNGSVYGGGELASVGVIDYRVDSNDNYTQVIKHASHSNDGKEVFYDFGLSWPYEFKYVEGITGGTTHVNITGSAAIDYNVYGGGKGQVSFGDDVVGEGNSAVYYDEIDKQR